MNGNEERKRKSTSCFEEGKKEIEFPQMGETDGLDNDEVISQDYKMLAMRRSNKRMRRTQYPCLHSVWGGGLVHYISVEAERAKIRLRMTYPRGETG